MLWTDIRNPELEGGCELGTRGKGALGGPCHGSAADTSRSAALGTEALGSCSGRGLPLEGCLD